MDSDDKPGKKQKLIRKMKKERGYMPPAWTYMVEHDIAKYAAFTASRSYQVYGNAKIENEDKLVYKEAGRQVVELATPLVRKEEIEVVADSYYQGNTGELMDRGENDPLEKRYGFAGQGLLFKAREDRFSPAFGLLKVHYKRRPLFLAGIEIPGLEKKGLFDEMNPAVLWSLKKAITKARKRGISASICGQAPSEYPEIVEFLVKQGIDAISVNPDAVLKVRKHVSEVENQ